MPRPMAESNQASCLLLQKSRVKCKRCWPPRSAPRQLPAGHISRPLEHRSS